MQPISFHRYTEKKNGEVFSIIIPTWNNLTLLNLCIEAIRKNSTHQHQIIVHINEGNDGTKEWLNEQKIDHTFSKENVGICYGVNAAATLSVTNYIVYLNDDMYVCPEWDDFLWQEIKNTPDELFYFSSTLIEPRFTNNSAVLAPYDFGSGPSDFKEKELLSQFKSLTKEDWNGSSWPPSVMHRSTWELIDGFSIEFSPGMYSDPDISMKLWKKGVRNFKGIGKSKVYHFMSKSTGKLTGNVKAKNKATFLKKWGITSRIFYTYYLKMGTPYTGLLKNPTPGFGLFFNTLISRLKSFFI